MTTRSTFWLAATALAAAALAAAFALVAVVRAGDAGTTPAAAEETADMAGMEHGAAAPTEGVPDATASRGGTQLKPRIEGDVWVFDLETKAVRWEILPGTKVVAWTYNGLVPGPEIRVPYGQRVRVLVKNSLPDPTTVHWHGIAVPNAMDGVPDVTQKPIQPGETFTYEFDAIPAGRNSKGGAFLYHSHFEEDRQVGLGLAGAFVIEEPQPPRYDVERTILIQEWRHDRATGQTSPPMEMEGALPNFFTLNGKSFPATETIEAKRGDRVLLRLVGGGQFEHPMHLHGTDFKVVAKDGHPVPPTAQISIDVIQVSPGERYDIAFTASEPGKWVFHCHIGHHLTNDGDDPGGLLLVVNVT